MVSAAGVRLRSGRREGAIDACRACRRGGERLAPATEKAVYILSGSAGRRVLFMHERKA